ncbi:MAG: RecQ family ATP-dependent DNA helicase [Acetivibrionales bacterium]|jgi:ATP-dependent DNA helicase RecQ
MNDTSKLIISKPIVFIDSEIGADDKKIYDLGAVRNDGATFHSASVHDFLDFISNAKFICGHNIIHHDLVFFKPHISGSIIGKCIDTLYLSPLLFPKRPYHSLLKDDKLQSDELNNPLNDAIKAERLFYDEVNAFHALSLQRKQIYCGLLYEFVEFQGFFDYFDFVPYEFELEKLIASEFNGRICSNADISLLIKHYPVELAYALALIGSDDYYSITPRWLLNNYPKIDNVIKFLRNTPCNPKCKYCSDALNIHKELKKIFGYNRFRTYNREPLQERAVQAAVDGKSLIAVFPTGGGKSLTFQLPALMAGKAVHGLTVIISPLQSLMKDQVDNLSEKGIVDAVTINGLLSPIERSEAYERIASGTATLLYISPEMLRSKTIEKMLMARNIVRFVIDEAHCFSAWGQDFRVDYLYIGDFIRELQKKKQDKKPIPVSCFTATAKQKVISDIREYFKRKLDLDLELFATSATRENLHYVVLYKETDEEKYSTLRSLIEQKDCPTIVYVSRTKRSVELAAKLTSDGFPAKSFNGKMDPSDKIANQEAFINNEVKVIVATSAFGMGVDKKDVRLVIHYDISDSLENYIQEAGRAGREPSLQAECYVLYNDNDLDKHFILLNQTKLSISEIQQVWKSIKDLTRQRSKICCSPLEIARQAGWDDSIFEIETRVKTAVTALESAGYIKRGNNVPHVYATSILVKNMQEASSYIDRSALFSESQRQDAKRIIKSLISSRSIARAGNDDAESRVDYLADILGIDKPDVITTINLMRQEGLLADAQDMSAYILKSDSQNKSLQILDRFAKLEAFIFSRLPEEGCSINYKEWNEMALAAGVASSSVKNIKTLLYFLTIKDYIQKDEDAENHTVIVRPSLNHNLLYEKFNLRIDICKFIVEELYGQVKENLDESKEELPVLFSLVGLFNSYKEVPKLGIDTSKITIADIADALLYLSKIGAMKLEGGFLVLYNGMEIKRLVTDNRIKYKVDDYRLLDEFYKQKIRQIHIVGEYANLMVRNYDAALQFVQDYFQMDFKKFISKYFKDERARDIDRNITPAKYNQLFGQLSDVQSQIINDNESKYIVVAAGPGSGKTRVLAHKLASLLLLEDVKHEQLLMLTFSRAAATEFKKRLIDLIGNAAHFVEIKTFHSYCFDLLGKIGSLEGVENVVKNATEMINNGEVEPGKVMKSVLVIDEAQDMDKNEFALVQALIHANDDMRIIAVGDDDQNIYEFRGSDSKYLHSLIEEYGAVKYEMEENFRSKGRIVALSNAFIASLSNRMKSSPIQAVNNEPGTVEIAYHTSDRIEEAVANDVIKNYKGGKACVLTNTNYEALQIQGILTKKGIRVKLIQSNDGFRLYNLAEVRFFLKSIDANLKSPVINDDLWSAAKKRLEEAYADSTCLSNCLNMIAEFESVNSIKFRTDLEEFIKESNYDDFYSEDYEAVYVSTIHKAKGREFDTVFLLIKNTNIINDAEKRRLYVALTRAKESLFIHCNTDIFNKYSIEGVIKKVDTTVYDDPFEISIQMSHKDVVLNYFKDKKDVILKLRSGCKLEICNEYLFTKINGRIVSVAKFSKAFSEKLDNLKNKGYEPISADIAYIVAWQGEEDEDESAILLPILHLRKHSDDFNIS